MQNILAQLKNYLIILNQFLTKLINYYFLLPIQK